MRETFMWAVLALTLLHVQGAFCTEHYYRADQRSCSFGRPARGSQVSYVYEDPLEQERESLVQEIKDYIYEKYSAPTKASGATKEKYGNRIEDMGFTFKYPERVNDPQRAKEITISMHEDLLDWVNRRENSHRVIANYPADFSTIGIEIRFCGDSFQGDYLWSSILFDEIRIYRNGENSPWHKHFRGFKEQLPMAKNLPQERLFEIWKQKEEYLEKGVY